MRVFRPEYKDKSGQTKQYSKFYIEVNDHLGIARKFPGFNDKRLTMALGNQIEMLAKFKNAGQLPDVQICQWLQGIPDKLRMRLARIGLIDRNRAAAGKPITEHLTDYRQSIGDITKHARATYQALLKIFRDCKFVYWQDIQASRLYNYLMRLKTNGKISQRTFNAYLKSSKSFCAWMVQDRRASESPIQHLKPIRITEREINRRALEENELARFLDTTARGPERYGMTGYERYLIYRFAIETGLRASEIRSLTVGDFDFDNKTVTVRAGASKRKRQDIQPLKPNTANLLKEFFKNKTANAKAFGGTYKQLTARTADMVKADLEAAKISYVDLSGRVFDFHSLRHQTGTMLARAGVHPRDAQAFMRHSSIELTMGYYTHQKRGAEIETAAKLPDLTLSDKKEKTG